MPPLAVPACLQAIDGMGEVAWSYPPDKSAEQLSPGAIEHPWEEGLELHPLDFQVMCR